MNIQAFIAVRAAKNRKKWGKFAALRYVQRRNVPVSLYRLACQLEACKDNDLPMFLAKQAD